MGEASARRSGFGPVTYYGVTFQEGDHTVSFYFEVEDDRVIRQVERYGDCWVYSGDPRSYCPRRNIDGFDAYGECTPTPFSEISAEIDLIGIPKAEFERAWQSARASNGAAG